MAIFQLQAKDAVARLGHYDALNCIQNLSWDAAMNAENLQQLGDANYDAQTIMPEVTGSFEARSTGALSSFLSRMIYKLNAGTGEFEGYLAGSTMTGLNTQLIRESDLQFAVQDLIEAKKANEVFDRSTVIPRAHLSQIQVSAKTDGTASESFSFEADLLEVYRTPFHDLVSLPANRLTGSPLTTIEVDLNYDVESTTVDALAEYKIVCVFVDNVKILPASFTVTPGIAAKDQIILTGPAIAAGITFPLGARLSVLIYKKAPGTFPAITYPTTARFVKADQVDIWLFNPATTVATVPASTTVTVEAHMTVGGSTHNLNLIAFPDSDLLLRVQSVDFSIALNREPLKELRKNDRGNSVYFRAAQYPLTITAAVAMIETDLNEWAKLQSKDAYLADASPDTLNLADFENKEWIIAMRYYKLGVPIQTIVLVNARTDGRGSQIGVGGRAEVSYNFTGSKIGIQGAA